MKKHAHFSIFAFLLILAVLTGCSEKRPDGMPKLYTTKITIQYADGTPLDEAKLILHAKDQALVGGKWSLAGQTNARGEAVIYTDGIYQGLPVGEYSVAVEKIVVEGDPPPKAPMNAEEQKAYDEYMRSGTKQVRHSVVSADFAVAAQSPLTIKVEANHKNAFTLDIGEKVKIDKTTQKRT